MDIVPLKGVPNAHEDMLDPMRNMRHDLVYERNKVINQLMRNKSARRQFFMGGLRLPHEIELPKRERRDSSANEVSDRNTDPRRYENELSHFQNQAIVNELGEAGPISLNLTKAVARADSEIVIDTLTAPAAQKKTLVNVEIISSLKSYNGFLPNFKLPNSQRRAAKRVDNIISAQQMEKMEQVRLFGSRSPDQFMRKNRTVTPPLHLTSGRTANSAPRSPVDSARSNQDIRADISGKVSIGDQTGSRREQFASVAKSDNRSHSRNASNNGVETEMSPTTVKLQPKNQIRQSQPESITTRERKTETFGNMVNDYESNRAYMIYWKSDSLKKRYEKVVGQGSDQVINVNNTNTNTIYSKLNGKNVLDKTAPAHTHDKSNKLRCRCTTQSRERRRGSTLVKTVEMQDEGLIATSRAAGLKQTLNKRRLHPKSKNSKASKAKPVEPEYYMSQFNEKILVTKSAPATGHYNNRSGNRTSKRGVPIQDPNKYARLAYLRTSNPPEEGETQPGGPVLTSSLPNSSAGSAGNHKGTAIQNSDCLCDTGRGSLKSKRFSQVDAEHQTQSQQRLKDGSHLTEELHEIKVLKNVEQQVVSLNDSMSEGTNRMSANKIASDHKPSPDTKTSSLKQENIVMDHKRKQSHQHLAPNSQHLMSPKIDEENHDQAEDSPTRSKTGDILHFKDLNRNSKSIESALNEDGGSNLHEVLKPKGIEIYSTSQTNGELGVIQDDENVRIEGALGIETQKQRELVKVQLDAGSSKTPVSPIDRTNNLQTVNLGPLDQQHQQLLQSGDIITAVRSSASDHSPIVVSAGHTPPPLAGSGNFSGDGEFNTKLISVIPFDETMPVRNSTIKSQQSPDKTSKIETHVKEDDQQKQSTDINEREDLGKQSGDSLVTEITEEGQAKEQAAQRVDVEKLIVTASNPEAFASADTEFPKLKQTQIQDSIRDIGVTSDTPDDSRLNEHSKLKSNYDSKSNIISNKAVMNITEDQINDISKDADTSSHSKIGKASQVSKKSVFLKNTNRAFSVSSNVEKEQNSQQVNSDNKINAAVTENNSALRDANMTDQTIVFPKEEDSKAQYNAMLERIRENEATSQTDFQPLVEPLELALANGMMNENSVMFLPDTQDLIRLEQLGVNYHDLVKQQMGILRAVPDEAVAYLSPPPDSGYDSSLQREYLQDTRYVRPDGALMADLSREQLEGLQNQGGIKVVRPNQRIYTGQKGRRTKSNEHSPPFLPGSSTKLQQKMIDDWLAHRGGVERGHQKGQRIIAKSIDGKKRIINPTKEELNSHPDQFHIIQVKGSTIPFDKNQEAAKKPDIDTVSPEEAEKYNRAQQDNQNKYQELMHGDIQQLSRSLGSAHRDEEPSREVMVRDQAVSSTPFGTSVIDESPSPLRPRDVLENVGNHYILNIDNQQMQHKSPLNVVKEVMPQGIQSNTAALQKFLYDPQPAVLNYNPASTARTTSQYNEILNSGRLPDVPSRQEDIDTVYIHSTMKMQLDTTNQKSFGAVSQFNAHQAAMEDDKSDYTDQRLPQNQVNNLLKVANPVSAQISEQSKLASTYSMGQQQQLVTQQQLLAINQRFFSQRDVQSKQISPPNRQILTSTSPDETIMCDGQTNPAFADQSMKLRKNEISVPDESNHSDQDKGDRILDFSPNVEKEKESYEMIALDKEGMVEDADRQQVQKLASGYTGYTTSDPSISLPRQAKQSTHLRMKSNQELRELTDSDSHSQLEQLAPPTADIRISKSRKRVMHEANSNTITNNNSIVEQLQLQRVPGFPSNRSRPEPSFRPQHQQTRPQTTKNTTPRDRKIIFLMHKRREIQLRNKSSKWKTQVASQPDVGNLQSPRNAVKEGDQNQTFFKNVSDKMSTVFSLDPTSTKMATTIACETGMRPYPAMSHSYERSKAYKLHNKSGGTIQMHIKKTFNPMSSGGLSITTEQTAGKPIVTLQANGRPQTTKMVNLRAGSEAYRLLRRPKNAVRQAPKNDDLGHVASHLAGGIEEALNMDVGRGPILEIEQLYGPRLKTAEGTSRANHLKRRDDSQQRHEAGGSLLGNSVEMQEQPTKKMKLEAVNHNMTIKISSRKNLKQIARTKDSNRQSQNDPKTLTQQNQALLKTNSQSYDNSFAGTKKRRGSATIVDNSSMLTQSQLNQRRILNQPSAGDMKTICNFEKEQAKPERVMSGGSHTENRRRARRLHQTLVYQKQLDDQQKKLLKYYDLMNENKAPQLPADVLLSRAGQLEQRKFEVGQQIQDLKQAVNIQSRLNQSHHSFCQKTQHYRRCQ